MLPNKLYRSADESMTLIRAKANKDYHQCKPRFPTDEFIKYFISFLILQETTKFPRVFSTLVSDYVYRIYFEMKFLYRELFDQKEVQFIIFT